MATNDFQDWELLQTNSESELASVTSPKSGNSFDEIDSGGLIQVNYFSLDSLDRYAEGVDDDKSAVSDNPSWIDPGLEVNATRYHRKESGEFWSDSSSEQSEDRRFGELEGINEMGFPENEKKELKSEEIGEIHEAKGEKMEDLELCMDLGGIDVGSAKINDVLEDSSVDVEGNADLHVKSDILGEEKNENMNITSEGGALDETANKKSGELEKRSLVWWKMPMEFLKYCVLRMSPVWTVSVAAAVMGFVILGRRLYKMKKKAKGLAIKVAVDDKKASHVMSRVARLNEAFSVVKRVPVIRPSLPAIGSTSAWPVMSLR